jgi:hypothetical protein
LFDRYTSAGNKKIRNKAGKTISRQMWYKNGDFGEL